MGRILAVAMNGNLQRFHFSGVEFISKVRQILIKERYIYGYDEVLKYNKYEMSKFIVVLNKHINISYKQS